MQWAIIRLIIKVLLVLAFFGAITFFSYRFGVRHEEAIKDKEIAEMKAAQANALAAASQAARKTEQATQATLNEVQKDVTEKAGKISANVSAGNAASGKLHAEVKRYYDSLADRAASSDSGVAARGKAEQAVGGVLPELYREIDGAAGKYAEEADRARAAGSACEQAYDKVRKQMNGAQE